MRRGDWKERYGVQMLSKSIRTYPLTDIYRRYAGILLLFHMVAAAALMCVGGTALNLAAARELRRASMMTEREAAQEPVKVWETSLHMDFQNIISQSRTIECDVLERRPVYRLSEAEYEALLKLVQAEAGGEDEEGKLLVANVVFNRVKSSRFPNTVWGVIYQKQGGVYQFSPVIGGRMDRMKVSDETRRAVERALYGEDISRGALYFVARRATAEGTMSWFDRNLTWLFAHGGHEFYG